MKREMLKKLLSTTVATMFVINGLIISKVDAIGDEENQLEISVPNLSPIPENMQVNEGTLTVTESVNIQGSNVADEDAIRILNELLASNNITINENYNENSTTIIIGEVDDNIEEMNTAKESITVEDTASLKEEGYILAVESELGNGGTILIEGKDGDGTFYGVKTLEQLFIENDGELLSKDVVISDKPTMGTRGIVEGFYGNPWTHADRLDQLKFYGDYKMNTYIYAPKDDPYHRENWRDPYPESEMARMNELIGTATENKVDFVFAISPGIDIEFDGEEGERDFQALITKCESLYEMGVRSFAIFYDDIHNKEGTKQAEILNRFNEEFIKAKGDVKPLITVPTEYDTFAMNSGGQISQYTNDFSSTLDEDILVMWTGEIVVPEDLPLDNAEFVNSVYGDRMGIWWNYPTSDYMREKLALGPIYKVDTALEGEIDFFTMNPMEHAHMSKISLVTGADYSWNTSEYDYNDSWEKAIEMEYGDLAPHMLTFANHSSRLSSTGREDAPEVKTTMENVIAKLASGEDATTELNELYEEFDNMIEAADVLKSSLSAEVLAECNTNLDKLKLLGQNGKLALDLLVAESEKDTVEVNKLKTQINGAMSSLNAGKKVSEEAVLSFIKEAVSIGLDAKASFDVSSSFVVPGEEVTFKNTSSTSTAEVEWRFEGANIETSNEDNPVVTFEAEGVYSVELIAKNILGEDEIVRKGIVTVSNSASEETTNLSLNKTATASGQVSAESGPQAAIDGNDVTKWCAVYGQNHNITIDLGKVSTITNIVMKHAGSGGEAISWNTRDYTIEVSTDGQTFTQVAHVDGNTANVTDDKIKVTNARYVKVTTNKPTQVTDPAARIFEIEVMGLDEAVDLPNNYIEPRDNIIYPVPQETTYLSEEGMSLEGEVNIVIEGNQESGTQNKLEEILEQNNIEFVISDAIDNNKANIIVTSDKENVEGYGVDELVDDISLTKKEGYVIKATDDINEKGNVVIVSSDEDGAYNGVLSLGQILEKAEGDKFAEIVVSDYPEIEYRGFIEGFYGTPWSHEDRISLMKDTSEFKMNTYIYAPKDDIYHRANWRELYPDDLAAEIAELAEVGEENNLNFCWTIHPGATLNFTDADYDALINKFEQMYALGVRQFGVLFDDTDDWTRGRLQAEWINRLDEEFVKVKGDVEPMIVISARYNSAWGPNMNSYFKPFMETLNDDIQVMWTGHATMSNVSKEVFEWPKIQTGVDKDLAVWWNYPVNDYCDSRLLMAPMHNLSKDLDNVSAFYSNPMNQAEASKVALYSIADYSWNTDSFEYMESWETSIEKLVPEVSEEFKRFAGNVSYLSDDGGASGPFVYDESVYLIEKIEALNKAIANGESIVDSANSLIEEFNLILDDYDSIVEKIENENLLIEIQIFLDSYKALGEAGVASMEALIEAENGNLENWLDKSNLATEKIDLMETYTIDRVESHGPQTYVVAVGEKRLKPLVEDMIRYSSTMISENVLDKIEPEIISSVEGVETVVNFEEGKYSVESIQNISLNSNGYIGIALPRATRLGRIHADVNNTDNLVLKYSLNGIEWEESEITVEDGVIEVDSVVEATYVKLVNASDEAKEVSINEMELLPVYEANPTASQNIGQYAEHSVSNILDGDMDTRYWSDKPAIDGHHITVDLGNLIPLHDVSAYFGNTDYIRNAEYQISEDGVNWTSLGRIEYETEGVHKVAKVDAEGEMARYIRIESTGENSGYWVQLFEIEYNKTVPNYGSSVVNLVTGSPDGKFDYLYDNDLTTAYEPTEVSDGDALIYKMTRITNVGDLMILQDKSSISEAVVSVKDLQGNWREVGLLGTQLSTLAINEEILAVKFEFSGDKPLPKIYEIIVRENDEEDNEEVEEVYKSELQIAVDIAKGITEEQLGELIPVVVEEFKAALAEAEVILSSETATQSEVNDSFKRLSRIMHMLEFVKGDKTHLESLIEEIEELDSEDYLPNTWGILLPILEEAKAIIADKNALENDVQEIYKKTIRAFLELRLKPNKDRLQDLINKVEALDEDKYTEESFEEVKEAFDIAVYVLNDENATEENVEKAEERVERALNHLVEKSVDDNKDDESENENEGTEENNGTDEENREDLPQTGGTSAVAVSILGLITSFVGAYLFKKKK